jgi:hypothetical protein
MRCHRSLPLVLCAVLICAAAPALAGTSIFAGLAKPLGDLNDAADMGFHAGAAMRLPVVPMTLSAGPTVTYTKLAGPGDDDSFTFVEALLTGRFAFISGPHVIGGFGYTFTDASIGGLDVSTDDEFTVVIGAGTSFAVLDIDAVWHHLGDTSFITLTAGLGF